MHQNKHTATGEGKKGVALLAHTSAPPRTVMFQITEEAYEAVRDFARVQNMRPGIAMRMLLEQALRPKE
jgi:hypothetical protein